MLNIDELIKESLKNKKTVELKAYRNLKSEITLAKTAKNAMGFNEAVLFSIITKYCKKLEDAEKQYSQAGREDLATEYRDELEVLRKLLPEPVKESDICDFVQGYAIDRNWVGTDDVSTRVMIPKKNMGEVIKATKSQFPTADGKIISEIVKLNLE